MKTTFQVQLVLLLSVATTLTVAAPSARKGEALAERQWGNSDSNLKSLCSSNSYHCVYAQDKQAYIDRNSAYGCDSKGTTCVFQSGSSGTVSCPDGQINFYFGSSNSNFQANGNAQAYFSSHNGDTSNTYSSEAGDDIHVTCSGSYYNNGGNPYNNGPYNNNNPHNHYPYNNGPYLDRNTKKDKTAKKNEKYESA